MRCTGPAPKNSAAPATCSIRRRCFSRPFDTAEVPAASRTAPATVRRCRARSRRQAWPQRPPRPRTATTGRVVRFNSVVATGRFGSPAVSGCLAGCVTGKVCPFGVFSTSSVFRAGRCSITNCFGCVRRFFFWIRRHPCFGYIASRFFVQPQLGEIAGKLNTRPRQTLSFHTPAATLEAVSRGRVEPSTACLRKSRSA